SADADPPTHDAEWILSSVGAQEITNLDIFDESETSDNVNTVVNANADTADEATSGIPTRIIAERRRASNHSLCMRQNTDDTHAKARHELPRESQQRMPSNRPVGVSATGLRPATAASAASSSSSPSISSAASSSAVPSDPLQPQFPHADAAAARGFAYPPHHMSQRQMQQQQHQQQQQQQQQRGQGNEPRASGGASLRGGHLVDEHALANATLMYGDSGNVRLLQTDMRASSNASSHSSSYSSEDGGIASPKLGTISASVSGPPHPQRSSGIGTHASRRSSSTSSSSSSSSRSSSGVKRQIGRMGKLTAEAGTDLGAEGGASGASVSSTAGDDTLSEHGKEKRRRVASKRNACEACYNGRVKCEYSSESAQRCKRCERLNKECVSRIVFRGGKPKSNKFINKINEYRANASQSGPTGLAILAGSVFVPQHNLSHIELASAAQALVDLYRELGLGLRPPTALRWLLNSLTLTAIRENNTTRLHHCTSVAMASGYKLHLDQAARGETASLPPELNALFDREIDSEIYDSTAGAAFVIKHEGAVRTIQANQDWEFLFETTASMSADLVGKPHGLLWSRYVERRFTEQFAAAVLMEFLRCGEPKTSVPGMPPRVAWTYTTPTKVEFVDSERARYSGNMYQTGVLSIDGRLLYFIVGFRNIEALDNAARARLQAAQRARRGAESSGYASRRTNAHGIPHGQYQPQQQQQQQQPQHHAPFQGGGDFSISPTAASVQGYPMQHPHMHPQHAHPHQHPQMYPPPQQGPMHSQQMYHHSQQQQQQPPHAHLQNQRRHHQMQMQQQQQQHQQQMNAMRGVHPGTSDNRKCSRTLAAAWRKAYFYGCLNCSSDRSIFDLGGWVPILSLKSS
ncbi:Hypothetical Protein FCC1311_075002, partial [Hondaea fermentalgiana]